MAKIRTSKKHERFSLDDLPVVVRKRKSEVWSPSQDLMDRDRIARALFQCVIENDMRAFFQIFEAHAEARGITEALKGVNVARSTYYSAKSTRDPRVSTISRLMQSVLAR